MKGFIRPFLDMIAEIEMREPIGRWILKSIAESFRSCPSRRRNRYSEMHVLCPPVRLRKMHLGDTIQQLIVVIQLNGIKPLASIA